MNWKMQNSAFCPDIYFKISCAGIFFPQSNKASQKFDACEPLHPQITL
jgi:hypothetical protein